MVAGITGHQNLGPAEVSRWVRTEIRNAVERNNVERGYVSLAVGADQLFADIALELEIPYTVVLPCSGYEQTFSKVDLPRFRYFLQRASAIRKLPFARPSEQAFYEAGKFVVEHSDFILAVWNGKPARGLGGTADIVSFAKANHKPVIQLNPLNRDVVDSLQTRQSER